MLYIFTGSILDRKLILWIQNYIEVIEKIS